ncbi:beta-glucanosyltransferase gel2 [Delphinella strobiligena]|nr:beta-glucanosyltransferase gel2 [Delphinella strobiligena]
MARFSVKSAALAATAALSSVASAVQLITVDGANFIQNGTGDRFSIIGVDYQPGGSSGLTSTKDPLSQPEACLRDAILMQRLGVNTIRVYNLDNDIDHDQCVSIFNAAGIYMILDVNSGTYGTYIDRTDPASTYTLDYLKHVFGVIEAFAQYPNTLGFFSGNEIINEDSSYEAPMYIRAVTRDMKEYIANNIDRDIGVGYSAADVDSMLTDTWNYLACDLSNSTSSRIDFFGLNDYSWCGDSSFSKAGYDKIVEMFEGTNIPVFFSEYGCNDVEPRTFTNVAAMYGDQMSVMSGGLVYEYSEESDNYGLVSINSTTEVTLISDYTYLSSEFAKIDYSNLKVVNKTAENQAATSCKAALITETAFLNAWGLPDAPSGAASLISSGLKDSSISTGTLVSVTATTMPATVYSSDASTKATGLSLIILDADDSNYPGLYKTYKAASDSEAQPTYSGGSHSSGSDASSTSSGSSSSSTSKSGAGSNAVVNTAGLSIAAFVVSLFFL